MKLTHFSASENTEATFSNRQPPSAVAPPEQISWGKAEALQRLGGDEDLLRELCDIFLNESPKLLQQLREAIAAADPDAVMRAAHSLKGELGYLGATEAVKAARELEDMGHGKNLSQAGERFMLLEREFASLHLAVKESPSAKP